MDRKIMFFDIDGTLLVENTHTIPESTVAAIRKAREKGHLAFINTGRTFFNVEDEIKAIGFDGYVCGCGTYIVIDNQVIEATTIDKATGRNIITLLRKYNLDAFLEGLEDVYFDSGENSSEEIRNIRTQFAKRGYGIKKNWDSEDLHFDKILAKADREEDIEAFKAELGDSFQYIDRGGRIYEIVPAGYSKATGIKKVLDYYQLPLANAYVFGDSSNDLPMFEYVPNSIAMGNSDECILNVASFITKDVRYDGIAYALKKLRII
ncbi:MAG: HAD family hydrolase [Lachnoclostridium sp.]